MLSDSPLEPPTKPAPLQKASLYQTCRLVLNGLAAVPGFDQYISFDTNNTHDPLTKLWDICRQGSSLCLLFNTLRPETPIQFDPNVNKPKACVYYFIIACRDQLGFSQEGLFTVSDLFQDDTNGFVKVVTTVKRLLQLLEQNGIIEIRSTSNRDSDPKDTRDKVVYELLETERKYVQDLEKLQHYMREAHAQKVLPPDTLHQLFGNLNALVDFQRRLLIQAEDNADKPPREQRFGNMFMQLEEPFSVYEPFCANFQAAQDLVVQETAKLQKLSDILSPTYELPSMLIKPVQRVCKYPLLLQQLVKETPADWPYYEEMKDGLEAIQRVASKVNETKRQQENIQLVEELRNRLEDDIWKNALSQFGALLLHERFTITRKEIDHDVLMYLFQKSLFICKEDVSKRAVKRKKKAGIKENALSVKGCFMISQIAQVTDTSSNGSWSLRVFWSERDQKSYNMQAYNLKSFLIKCRNDEQLRQWESMLSKLVENEKRQSKVDKVSTPSNNNSVAPSVSSEHKSSVKHMVPRPPVTSNFYKSGSRVSYIEYEETDSEEEDEDDDEDEEEDDDDEPIISAARRSSQPAASYARSLLVENNNTGEHHQQRHHMPNSVQLKKKHSYNNMMIPGMTLPPLPRTGEESTPESVVSPPVSYPSSPLASYPSSPSTSTRASTSSAASANRRQDNGLLPTELIGRSLLGDNTKSSNEECTYPPYTSRARSQSTPNIHHYQTAISDYHSPPLPPLPIPTKDNNNAAADMQQHQHIKVKLNYMDGVYVVVVPENIQYQELLERIERKIQFCGQDFNSSLGLKYQDEDGDLITVSSDEDVQMGFESRGSSNTVNFYVISAS